MLDFNQIIATHIYDNVALLILSKDEKGEIWAHFGVEKRRLNGKSQHVLSTFGGAIDKKPDGTKENPIHALLREVEEESLGLVTPWLSESDLNNQEKTSTYCYTDPKKMTSTILFCTVLSHHAVNQLVERFEEERTKRLEKTGNARFLSEAETEVKALRKVSLKDIEKLLQGESVASSLQESIYFNLDKNSKIFDQDKNLVDYQIFKIRNRPVENVIPIHIPLRSEVLQSVRYALPTIKVNLLEENPFDKKTHDGSYVKTLRADNVCFFNDFLECLPIKGLEKTRPKLSLRRSKFTRFALRNNEMIDNYLKQYLNIGRQYNPKVKASYTKHQSISWISNPREISVFGERKTRGERLVGIKDFDILINRMFHKDNGTFSRPYNRENKEQLKETYENNFMMEPADLADFIERANRKQSYTEILARIRWNIQKTSVCVFSDNIESLWVAIYWSRCIREKIQKIAQELFQQGSLTQKEYDAFMAYTPSVEYSFLGQRHGEYTQDAIQKAQDAAKETYQNITLREEAFQKENYEFLLLVDELRQLKEIMDNHPLMIALLKSRPFIFETIIDKRLAVDPTPIDLSYLTQETLSFNRSFLRKINEGFIRGLGKIQKDRIFLSKLKFVNTSFRELSLNNIVFDDCYFKDCDFTAAQSLFFTTAVTFSGVMSDQKETICFLGDMRINIVDNKIAHAKEIWKKTEQTQELLEAVKNEDIVQVEKALGAGVCPNIAESYFLGATPLLMIAINNVNSAIALRLLQAGADPNIPQTMGNESYYPLLLAMKRGMGEVTDALLAAGADPHLGESSFTPLMLCIPGNNDKFFLEQLNAQTPDTINWTDDRKETALMLAAKLGKIDKVVALVKKGASINETNNEGETALIFAIRAAHKNMIETLLDNGADANIVTHNQDTPLLLACKDNALNDEQEVLLLLEHNANPNVLDDGKEETPLSLAIKQGKHHIAMLLLSYGADPNFNGTNTPLLSAIKEKPVNLTLIEMLIKKGAKLGAIRQSSYQSLPSALEVAVRCDAVDFSLVQLLVNNGAEIGDALSTACRFNHIEVVRFFLKEIKRRNLKLTPFERRIALMCAIWTADSHNNTIGLDLLLKEGFDLNSPEMMDGEATVLERVLTSDTVKWPTIQHLIHWGADINLLSTTGFNQLIYLAVKNCSVSILFKLGVSFISAIPKKFVSDASNDDTLLYPPTYAPSFQKQKKRAAQPLVETNQAKKIKLSGPHF